MRNIIVSDAAVETGSRAFGFFEFALVGVPLLLASMVYLVTVKCVVSGAGATAGPLLAFALGVFLLNSLVARFAANQQALRQVLHRLGAIFLLCALLFLLIIPLTVAVNLSTGEIDRLTAAAIQVRLNPQRPRLY